MTEDKTSNGLNEETETLNFNSNNSYNESETNNIKVCGTADPINNESNKCNESDCAQRNNKFMRASCDNAEIHVKKLDVSVSLLQQKQDIDSGLNINYSNYDEVPILTDHESHERSSTKINEISNLVNEAVVDATTFENEEVVDVLHIEPEMQLTISDELVDVIKNEPITTIVEHDIKSPLKDTITHSCSRCGRLRFCEFKTNFGSVETSICDECHSDEFKKSHSVDVDQHTTSVLGTTATAAALIYNDDRNNTKLKIFCEEQYSNLERKCAQCGLKNIVETTSLSWELMDFCDEDCLGLYQLLLGCRCANCKDIIRQIDTGKYCLRIGLEILQFCGVNCLEDSRKNSKMCGYCLKDTTLNNQFTSTLGDKLLLMDFCSEYCMDELYFRIKEENCPITKYGSCFICGKNGQIKAEIILGSNEYKLCSDACISAFKFKNRVINTGECVICKKLFGDSRPNAIFVFDDDKPLTLCSKICLNTYILTRRRLIPCNWCKIMKYNFSMIKKVTANGECLEMCSLYCLIRYQYNIINIVSTQKIPKSAAQRTKEYRERKRSKEGLWKKVNNQNSVVKKTPKSTTERVREYRARKKALITSKITTDC